MENNPIQQLQTDEPTMSFEDWYVALAKVTAEKLNIEVLAAQRRINVHAAYEWWEAGFTPFATFRETING
jgi:hypothetical protein